MNKSTAPVVQAWDNTPSEPLQSGPVEVRHESDLILAALIARGGASGGRSLANVQATAALESAAGLTGRSFAAADVDGPEMFTRAITPDLLETIGRELIRRGELVCLIDTSAGLAIWPAQSYDVDGPPDPRLWYYRVTVGGPSHTWTQIGVPANGVLHFRYGVDPAQPWRGRSPLSIAADSGRLSAETVSALADESSGPRGALLGLPIPGDDPTVAGLRSDLKDMAGKVALLETGDMGGAPGGGMVNLKPERVGANPPASMVELAAHASAEVWAACGYNPAIFESGQAASLREANRLALGVVAALGKKVEAELRLKLDMGIGLSWGEIRSTDIQTRTRSVGQLVTAGLPLADAMKTAGLTMVNHE